MAADDQATPMPKYTFNDLLANTLLMDASACLSLIAADRLTNKSAINFSIFLNKLKIINS